MTTKYDIGQNVWTMLDNQPVEMEISEIWISGKRTIFYQFQESTEMIREEKIFPTKEELKSKVFA